MSHHHKQPGQGPICCDEYRHLSRRRFLQGTGMAAAATIAAPSWMPRVVLADTTTNRDVLVVLFLRGAIDSLSVIVPHQESEYYRLRPTQAVPRPGQTNGCIDLDGQFGLHPGMASLMTAYNNGDLALVAAAGSNDPSRSHFDGQRMIEFGVPVDRSAYSNGWLARHLLLSPAPIGSVLRAATIGSTVPYSLYGAPNSLPVTDPSKFALPGRVATRTLRDSFLRDVYATQEQLVTRAALNTIDTVALLGAVSWTNYNPAPGVTYPVTSLGYALKNAAALIKAQVGVEVLAIDVNNFDTHAEQGTLDGGLNTLLVDLADSLAAFYGDLGTLWDRTSLVAMSEFGRRIEENGSEGTDHGHGTMMLAMGGGINGGRVLHRWPGLAAANLYEGLDLAVTIDYRNILAEILARRCGAPDVTDIFGNMTISYEGIVA